MISELHTPDPIASTAHLTLVHPAIATLEATMVDQENRVNVATEANSEGLKALEHIDSTLWAQRIENAYDKPEELAIIRRQYDESALQFMSAWLNWIGARRKMMDGRSVIHGVIVDALISLEQLDHLQSEHLKSIFQARLVAAAELHGRDVTDKVIPHHSAHKNRVKVAWLDPSQTIVELVDKIQVDAFRAMTAGLAASMGHDVYTTAFAVPDKSRANSSNPDGFECRRIEAVAFVDCVNSKHEESAKLFALLSLVEAAAGRCFGSDNVFTRQQKGSVNERQHSDRLLKFLHDVPTTTKTCGKVDNFEEQIKAQNERRYDFESNRQEFALNVRYFRALLGSIVQALNASTIETEALLTKVEGQNRTTIDEYETLRIMLNNCLSADASLRWWVHALLSHERKIKDDISNGAGTRAVRSRFDGVTKHYSWPVQTRKEELAPKPDAVIDGDTTGGAANK